MISVIIPTLNEERFLEATLRNLHRCKKHSLEIIISDGRSTDSTVLIAKKYADKVLIYHGKKRQTIAAGRNLGAAEARGEYLVFLDADVIIPEPDAFFSRMLANFSSRQNLVAANCFLKILPDRETLTDRIFSTIFNYLFMAQNNFLPIGAAGGEFQMIKREPFKAVGGFRENLAAGEDFELFRRLRKLGQTRTVPSLTVYHTGRRAHQLGWWRLMLTWFRDTVWLLLFGRTYSKVWEEVR
ncbi:MAG: glycosyltransferase [Candidatus Taylorbacteria bacterium]|nr:glycosyltransferase [Candidatus Taylorbacteria bacterium]